MDADLVGAAGVDARLDPRGVAQALERPEARFRRAASLQHSHDLPMRRVPRDRGPDASVGRREFPAEDGVVGLLHLPVGELPRQHQVRRVVFRHHHQPARVLVETMDDAGPGDAADAAEPALAMMEQGVDEGVVLGAGRGMHHHAGRLVEHEQGVVLEQDGERQVARREGRGLRGWPFDMDGLAGARVMRRLDDLVVDADGAGADEALQRVAGNARVTAVQKDVEAIVGGRGFDHPGFRAGGPRRAGRFGRGAHGGVGGAGRPARSCFT